MRLLTIMTHARHDPSHVLHVLAFEGCTGKTLGLFEHKREFCLLRIFPTVPIETWDLYLRRALDYLILLWHGTGLASYKGEEKRDSDRLRWSGGGGGDDEWRTGLGVLWYFAIMYDFALA